MRGNPNPKPFAPGTIGTKPRIFPKGKEKRFLVLISDTMHNFVKKHGGNTLIRKLIHAEMEKYPEFSET